MNRIAYAVIDTSFWSLACHLDLDVYLFDFYSRPLFVPGAVLKEITHPDHRGPWIYPDSRRMTMAIEDGRISEPDVPYEPFGRFGEGERHAIGLAEVLDADLLINDRRPYLAARDIGIRVVSLPDFVSLVRLRRLITKRRASLLLDQMRDVTAEGLILNVEKELERNGDDRDGE